MIFLSATLVNFIKSFFTIDAARLVGYLLLEFIKSGRLRVLQ